MNLKNQFPTDFVEQSRKRAEEAMKRRTDRRRELWNREINRDIRVVAWIDILGFSNEMLRAKTDEEYRAVYRIFSIQPRVVDFVSTLLDEEQRTRVPILDCRQSRNQDFVRVCSWCQRIAVRGSWLSVEAGVEALGLMLQPMLPALTHGICGDCEAKVLVDLAALRNSA